MVPHEYLQRGEYNASGAIVFRSRTGGACYPPAHCHAFNPSCWRGQRLPCFVLNLLAPRVQTFLQSRPWRRSLHSMYNIRNTRLAVPCPGRSVSGDRFGNWRCQPNSTALSSNKRALPDGSHRRLAVELTRADCFRWACDNCLPIRIPRSRPGPDGSSSSVQRLLISRRKSSRSTRTNPSCQPRLRIKSPTGDGGKWEFSRGRGSVWGPLAVLAFSVWRVSKGSPTGPAVCASWPMPFPFCR